MPIDKDKYYSIVSRAMEEMKEKNMSAIIEGFYAIIISFNEQLWLLFWFYSSKSECHKLHVKNIRQVQVNLKCR